MPLSGIAPYIRGEAATFIPISLLYDERDHRVEDDAPRHRVSPLPLGFFRTHKGYIVNLSMIQEIQNQDNGILLLTLAHSPREKVPVSRHYIKDFKNTLHWV